MEGGLKHNSDSFTKAEEEASGKGRYARGGTKQAASADTVVGEVETRPVEDVLEDGVVRVVASAEGSHRGSVDVVRGREGWG